MLAAGRRAGRSLRSRTSWPATTGWWRAPASTWPTRFRCPLVMTIHATEYGRHQGWVADHPQSWIHGIERWITHRADRVIACSHYMRGHVADVFGLPEERISVIPNGIDPMDLQPVEDLTRAARALCREPEEKLVLLVGRLVYEKGFQLALEALAPIVRRSRASASWSPAREPTRTSSEEQAREPGVDRPRRCSSGWIGDDVLHSLYRIADLCVVPSIYEPFGLVALEAMASGCPCIVADTGGLARGGALGRARGAALQRGRRRPSRRDDRAAADRRAAARPAGRRGLGARAALRLERRRPAHADALSGSSCPTPLLAHAPERPAISLRAG